MATANYRKRRAITSKSRTKAFDPTPNSNPPPDPIVDVPDPPADPSADVPEPSPVVEPRPLPPIPDQIEEQRTEVLTVQAMARCLAEVLQYADDDDSVYHSDVAQVIARLLDDVAVNLELIKHQIPSNDDTDDDDTSEVEV